MKKYLGETQDFVAQSLTLHAALGCAASSAMGGSCGAGAAGAVAGELTAEYAYNNLHLDKNTSIALASVTSAGAALLTSSLQGNDDEHTAKNVQLGSILGSNAAENNAVSDGIGVSPLDEESQNYKESRAQLDEKVKSLKTDLQNPLVDIAVNSKSSTARGLAFAGLVGVNVVMPESVDEIGLMLLGTGATKFASMEVKAASSNVLEEGSVYTHGFKYDNRVRERGLDDPVGHNFPYSFDDLILSNTPNTTQSGYRIFQQPGKINGVEGVYEIGLTNADIINHRTFRSIK